MAFKALENVKSHKEIKIKKVTYSTEAGRSRGAGRSSWSRLTGDAIITRGTRRTLQINVWVRLRGHTTRSAVMQSQPHAEKTSSLAESRDRLHSHRSKQLHLQQVTSFHVFFFKMLTAQETALWSCDPAGSTSHVTHIRPGTGGGS